MHIDDTKYFHRLYECADCHIKFRFPQEPEAAVTKFYQGKYFQPGLTSQLPSNEQLEKMMANNFKNTEKDFSRLGDILRVLGLPKGVKILDSRTPKVKKIAENTTLHNLKSLMLFVLNTGQNAITQVNKTKLY